MADQTQQTLPPPPPGFVPLQSTTPTALQQQSAVQQSGNVPPPPPGFVPVPPSGFVPAGQQQLEQSWWRDPEEYAKQHPSSFLGRTKQVGDVLQDMEVGPTVGLLKGAGETVLDADKLIRRGLRWAGVDTSPTGITGTQTERNILKRLGVNEDYLETALEAKTPGEKFGKAGETVIEFMLGDEALKALSSSEKFNLAAKMSKSLEEYPIIAKLAAHGLESLRAGVAGGGQSLLHGASPSDAATAGAYTAAAGPVGTVLGKIGGAALRAVSRDTVAEATEAAVRRAAQTAEESAQKGEALAGTLRGGAGKETQTDIVGKVQQWIRDFRSNLESTYEAGRGDVNREVADAGGIRVNIDGSPLQKTAKNLIEDERVPAELRDKLAKIVPEKERMLPLLKALSKGSAGEEEAIESGLLDESGRPITRTKAGTQPDYSWDQMEATRQRIGREIRDLAEDNPMRRDLIGLRHALDETMEKAATDAGKPEIAQHMKSVRAQYAEGIQKLEEQSIKRLADSDPDSVAKILMNPESVHTVANLRSVIGPANMKAVEGGMFQQLFDQAADANGNFDSAAMARGWKNMPNETKKAIWGDRVGDIQDFVTAATKGTEAAKAAARKDLLAAKAGSGLIAAARIGSAAYGIYQIQQGNYKQGALEIMVPTVFGSHVVIRPRALQNPAVLKAVTQVMKAAGSPNARRLASAAVSYLIQQGSFPPLEMRRPASGAENSPDRAGAAPGRAGVALGAGQQ